MKSTIIKITLWIGIISLAYFGLYGNITNEIKVRKSMDKRIKENVQRLQDLREIQKQYKREKGFYASNSDSLTDFLFNSEIAYLNTEKADADSIAINVDKWKSIQNQLRKKKSNALNETSIAKGYYKKAGGKWRILTEQEKIDKGYISVEFFVAKDLIFTEEYQNSRNSGFKLNMNSLNSIKNIYNAQSSELYNKLNAQSAYNTVNGLFSNILNLNDSSESNFDNLNKAISSNKTEIENLRKNIEENKSEKTNSSNVINGVKAERKKYTELIGESKILKVREKARIKQEKGKTLKGRKAIIYNMVTKQDSIETVNKNVISNCKNNISNFENEIDLREQLTKLIEKNIQCIKDVSEMQKGFINYKNTKSTSFDSLLHFTLNEEIKIVTTLKKGSYTIATSPDLWKSAKVKADLFITESLGENMLNEVNEKYKNNGGKWRDLTEEEGLERGLTIVKYIIAKDVIFNDIYMSKRNPDFKLNFDSLIYVPHNKTKYTFKSGMQLATLAELSQGGIDKYFFAIYTDYEKVFNDLDKEYKVLQRASERDSIMVGSLVKTITNGNWGE